MNGYRQAAAVLHHLDERDRGWILAGLPAAERAELECYLDELKNLGFANSDAPDRPAPAAASDDGQDPAAWVRRAPADRIAAILENEPPSLVAQLIAIEAWPWESAVLGRFSAGLRDRIAKACAGSMPIASARRAFLVQAIADRIVRADDAEPHARPHAGLHVGLRYRASAIGRAARGLRSTLSRLSAPWKR